MNGQQNNVSVIAISLFIFPTIQLYITLYNDGRITMQIVPCQMQKTQMAFQRSSYKLLKVQEHEEDTRLADTGRPNLYDTYESNRGAGKHKVVQIAAQSQLDENYYSDYIGHQGGDYENKINELSCKFMPLEPHKARAGLKDIQDPRTLLTSWSSCHL